MNASEILLAWSTADAGVYEALLWFDESGTILRQHEVELPESEAVFVYVRGGNVVLVQHPVMFVGGTYWHGLIARTYNENAVLLATDTLFQENLTIYSFVGPNAFALRGEELIAPLIVGEAGTDPVHTVRVIRHTPDTTIISPVWTADFPDGSYLNVAAVTTGPGESAAMLFGVFRGDTAELHVTGLHGGAGTNRWHVQPLVVRQSLTGASLVWHAGSVYSVYTTNNISQPESGGAYVLGFPADEIAAANDRPIGAVRGFRLAAYPNPFNAVTRLAFSLDHVSDVSLEVFDATGRLVDRVLLGQCTSGDHVFLWQAGEFPSGTYFARLHSSLIEATAKLVLIR